MLSLRLSLSPINIQFQDFLFMDDQTTRTTVLSTSRFKPYTGRFIHWTSFKCFISGETSTKVTQNLFTIHMIGSNNKLNLMSFSVWLQVWKFERDFLTLKRSLKIYILTHSPIAFSGGDLVTGRRTYNIRTYKPLVVECICVLFKLSRRWWLIQILNVWCSEWRL